MPPAFLQDEDGTVLMTCFTAGVTPHERSVLTVAIAAAPPMVAGSLQLVLSMDARVTVVVEETSQHFDVLVTTPGGPQPPASVVIELDTSPRSRGGGLLRSATAAEPEELVDLEAVLTRIRAIATR
ncbi:MAG: hypothetical protein ACLFV0_11320 [Nitriliruptoraceae bacterium]